MNPMQEFLLAFLINPSIGTEQFSLNQATLTDMFFYVEAEKQGYIKNGRLTQAGYDFMTLQENDDGTV